MHDADAVNYSWVRDTDFSTWTKHELKELVVELTGLMRECIRPPFNQTTLREHCREMRGYVLAEMEKQ